MRACVLVMLLLQLGSGVTLTAMTFNLFYGGTSLNLTDGGWCHPKPHGCPGNLARVAEAIRFAGADVAGLEETEGNVEAIAELLGWHWSARAHVVSRFPLAQVPGEPNPARAVLVEAAPGAWLLLGVAHAPSDPYGPYLVRDNASLASVLELERSFRAPPVLAFASRLQRRAAALGVPWLLVGDFNTPSQLDWTPAAVAARSLPRPVAWPMGQLLADTVGAVDVFRVAHPDPVANPGITWSPWGPEDEPPQLEIQDRVDWILAGPNSATVLNASVVGAPGPWRFWPWPSDHYAVRAVLDVRLVPAVQLAVAHSRVVPGGAPLEVYCNSSNLVVTLDGRPIALPTGWSNVSVTALADGIHVLATAETEVNFWVVRQAASLAILDPNVYPGNPIPVMIRNAPGMMLDYLAVYPCGGGSVNRPSVYVYTEALITGTVYIRPPFYIEGNRPLWPLPPGCYVVALLRDDDPTAFACPAISFVVAQPLLAWYVYVAPLIAGLLIVGVVVVLCIAYRRRKDGGIRFEKI